MSKQPPDSTGESSKGLFSRFDDRLPTGAIPNVLRRTFAAKFFGVVLVVMLVTSSVGAYNYASTQDALESDVKNRVTSTAELQAGSLGEWVQSKRTLTRTLSQAQAFRTYNRRGVSYYLEAQEPSLPDDVEAVHFVNSTSWNVVVSSNEDAAGTDLRESGVPWATDDRAAALERPRDVFVSSRPYDASGSDARVVAFVSPVPDKPDRAVVLTVNISAQVNGLHQPVKDGETVVYNANGDEVFNTGDAQLDGKLAGDAIVGSGANDGLVTTSDFVANHKSVAGANWVVVSYAPKASAFAMRDRVGTSLLTTILAALLALGVVSVVFERRTTATLNELTSKAEEIERGDLDTELRSGRIDELGQLYEAFASMRDSLAEKIRAAESAREEAQEAQQVAERERREAQEAKERAETLNGHLERKADSYSDVMQEAADGDLSRRMDADAESDAMARIASAYNRMMDELTDAMLEVRSFSREVAGESEQATDSLAEVERASEEVSESVQEISDGAVEQNRSLQRASEEMSDLSATVEEVASSTETVAQRVEQAAEEGQEGQHAAEDAIEELDSIEERTERTAESVERLREEVGDIEEVVGFVTDIAEQTHVLALNASIEAARAGEAGQGFAVVAEEVKNLAEQTQSATDEIGDSIERVRDQTETTVEEMHETRTSVSDGTETVETALEALEQLVEDVSETNDSIHEISRATESQADSVQQVVTTVEDVSSVSEETTAQAETVSAAAEEQTASLTEVSNGVKDLADRAERLSDLLEQFDFEDGGRTAPESDAGRKVTPK
ncbi:methyl-accepting chemotaxis protein [Halorussus gelatinilyticus]|uniref:Methyl-accepting chemotaxis protein n=1 Tax=Halorussus gelatinilyticus TaxID=2937524 RepID=A0A8U0IHS4_9EURY|nr:methyl-accepting chemotaxis protein [Halorussus gelatinilyticus]UPW00553.1 methyl-accepting chemotaxis protein [Halorussus gelatinilyticus]